MRGPKRTRKLSANVTEDELAAFAEACRIAEIESSDTLRKLANALCIHVQQHGHVTFPIRIAPPPSQKRER